MLRTSRTAQKKRRKPEHKCIQQVSESQVLTRLALILNPLIIPINELTPLEVEATVKQWQEERDYWIEQTNQAIENALYVKRQQLHWKKTGIVPGGEVQ